MRGGNKPHDAGERCLLTDRGNANPKAPAACNRSRDTAVPGLFGNCFDSPVIIDSSTSAAPSTTVPSAGNAVSGPDKDDVTHVQFPQGNDLNFRAIYAFSSIRKQGGKGIERAMGLRYRSHFQPMAENHDRNERRKLPPHFDLEQTECRRERGNKRNDDGQSDQGHHPGFTLGKLAPRSTNENKAAVKEDDRSKDRWNQC